MYSVPLCRQRKGFLLLEVVLGIAIFAVFIGGVSYVMLNGQESTKRGIEQQRAAYFAEGAIEVARTIRDQNFDLLTAGGPYGYRLQNGQWEFFGTESVTDGYHTSLVIQEIVPGSRVRVTATTTWKFGNERTGEVQIVAEFTNWRVEREFRDWRAPEINGTWKTGGPTGFQPGHGFHKALASFFSGIDTAYAQAAPDFQDVIGISRGDNNYAIATSATAPGLYVFDITNEAEPVRIATTFALPNGYVGGPMVRGGDGRLYVVGYPDPNPSGRSVIFTCTVTNLPFNPSCFQSYTFDGLYPYALSLDQFIDSSGRQLLAIGTRYAQAAVSSASSASSSSVATSSSSSSSLAPPPPSSSSSSSSFAPPPPPPPPSSSSSSVAPPPPPSSSSSSVAPPPPPPPPSSSSSSVAPPPPPSSSSSSVAPPPPPSSSSSSTSSAGSVMSVDPVVGMHTPAPPGFVASLLLRVQSAFKPIPAHADIIRCIERGRRCVTSDDCCDDEYCNLDNPVNGEGICDTGSAPSSSSTSISSSSLAPSSSSTSTSLASSSSSSSAASSAPSTMPEVWIVDIAAAQTLSTLQFEGDITGLSTTYHPPSEKDILTLATSNNTIEYAVVDVSVPTAAAYVPGIGRDLNNGNPNDGADGRAIVASGTSALLLTDNGLTEESQLLTLFPTVIPPLVGGVRTTELGGAGTSVDADIYGCYGWFTSTNASRKFGLLQLKAVPPTLMTFATPVNTDIDDSARKVRYLPWLDIALLVTNSTLHIITPAPVPNTDCPL